MIDVLGALLEIAGAEPQVFHQIFSRLLELSVQPVELIGSAPLGFRFAIEALELSLLLSQQALLFVRAGVAVLLFHLEDLVGQLLAPLIEGGPRLVGLLGRPLQCLARLVELGLVDRRRRPAQLLGEILQRVPRLREVIFGERQARRASELGLRHRLTHRLEPPFERLSIGGRACRELLVE